MAEQLSSQQQTAESTSTTITIQSATETAQEGVPTVHLKLRKPETDRKVQWTTETVDNEEMDKKKSKCCCIYKKPHAFDESSSDSSDDDDEVCNHVERRKKKTMHQHVHAESEAGHTLDETVASPVQETLPIAQDNTSEEKSVESNDSKMSGGSELTEQNPDN